VLGDKSQKLKGKEMKKEGEKPKINDEDPTKSSSKSHKDGKNKKLKKVVYYETDSFTSPSTSSSGEYTSKYRYHQKNS
jgi:hypothetical protein